MIVSIYDMAVRGLDGTVMMMRRYEGQVLLVVNTASKCGLTSQYSGLEQIYRRYSTRGFSVLGFPCNQFNSQEPGDEQQIASFCEHNYDVTFPMFSKIDVNGPKAHPLFVQLKSAAPGIFGSRSVKWNFTKFLVNRDGKVVRRFAPTATPADLDRHIEAIL